MDVEREVRWTIPKRSLFEERVREYLLEKKSIEEGMEVFSLSIVTSAVANFAKVRLIALECVLGISGDELNAALEACELSDGEIIRALAEAMMIAENPSLVPSLQKSWSISDAAQKAEKERAIEEQTAKEMDEQHRHTCQLEALDLKKKVRAKQLEALRSKADRDITKAQKEIDGEVVEDEETTKPTPTPTCETST